MFRLWSIGPFLILLGLAWFFPEPLAKASSSSAKPTPSNKPPGNAKSSQKQSTTAPQPITAPSSPSKTTVKTAGTTSPRSASGTKKKKTTAKKRGPKIRGQQEIEPERVAQIQGALAGAGYYVGEPSGKWDEGTMKAMRAYQDSNGFKVTGKPDALSLKKLGL